jgi:hypothetical protein
MKKNRFKFLMTVMISASFLSACSFFNKEEETSKSLEVDKSSVTSVVTPAQLPSQLSVETPNEALKIRLAFDEVKVGDIDHEGQGGSSLIELQELFGNYTSKEDRNGGDVTINAYTWELNGVVVVAQMYQDSTIARSISNFAFGRQRVITIDDFNKLEEGQSYKKVVDILGEPDVLAESVSSDGERIDATWTSNLISEEQNPGISLSFKDGKLSKLSQFGLE